MRSRDLKTQLAVSVARASGRNLLIQRQAELETGGSALKRDFRPVRFEAIDIAALSAFYGWEQDAGFPWQNTAAALRKCPRALDISFWYHRTLCGLCFARPNGSKTLLKIELIEGRPGVHPLSGKVTELMLLPINAYAKFLRARVIEMVDPAAGAVAHYKSLGFRYEGSRLVRSVY